MTQEPLPRLTEAQVLQLANQQSFERGKSYYRDGAIVEPVRQGWALRAQCEGSDDEPYVVSATLAPHGIAATSCTCPYDWGCLLYTSPSPRDRQKSRMPSSA